MNKIKKGMASIDRIIETSRNHHSCEIDVTSKQGVVNVYLRATPIGIAKNEMSNAILQP